MQFNGSHNAIMLPTRISTDSDICVTNLSETYVMLGVITNDIRDHLPMFCCAHAFHTNNRKGDKTYTYDIINDNSLQHFKELVCEIQWESLLNPNISR